MKLITAIIRTEQLPAIKESLAEAQFRSYFVSTVLSTAPKREQQIYRGVARKVTLVDRVRIEIAVKDEQKERAIEAITTGAKQSGEHGMILVTNLEDAVMVWSGERGDRAL